ncbi:MAG: response regulator transcription factor [Holophagales bacterium]|nr:response regulator transcription factor [Holophagales bacterium]
MAHILLVEDNRDLAYGLSTNLEIEGYTVTVAATAAHAFERSTQLRPDLVILDLMLPDGSGFDVLKRLRRQSDVPVLILTARGEEIDKVQGLRSGADDYVTKPFGLLELLARVEALLRRTGSPEDERVERFGNVEVDPARRTVRKAGRIIDLAPKELELLLALCRRRGAAVPRADLMRDVWGYHGAVVSRTVDTHIAELRRKLEDDPSNPRHILTVRKLGYRLSRDR